jgi:acetyl esterase/lipase
LWAPSNVANAPVVIAIHGGGFVEGDAKGFQLLAKRLTTFGFAVASINYRLTKDGNNIFPAAISDVRCAARWLQANASELNIDGTRFAVLGASAGGNLAGLLATNANPGGAFDVTPGCLVPPGSQPPIVAMADYYGLNDIGDQYALNTVQTRASTLYLGVAPQDDEQLAFEASPITYVTSSTPPTLIARGTDDSVMPEAQATIMAADLQAAGVPVQYYDIPGLGHDFGPTDVEHYGQLEPSACAMISLFQKALGVAPR